ncbi:hypothetical protein F5148DRAFT_1195363 [Russula earlei]|uniref:Uncharacterized protein n=1 Tax=Russula earlei TaxID=71964 RepID=A0ACC0UBS8_9AGAM|nr:hypothetical protein F5148DRAFT_1195363 [Russula earlei]
MNTTLAVLKERLQNIEERVQNIQDDVAFLRRHVEEMPILLANSQAGTRGRLYNPTIALVGGWAPLMEAPNPVNRDALFMFTVNECVASARNLGLPPLPPGTPVAERRRQIARRIGVAII